MMVPVVALDVLLDRVSCSEVHFLRLGCSAMAADLLRGMNWHRCRPWVILAAADIQSPSAEEMDGLLHAAGYQRCYGDRRNQFYVSAEKAAELQERLSYAPCRDDSFICAGEQALVTGCRAVEREQQQMADAFDEWAHEQIEPLREYGDVLEQHLSWSAHVIGYFRRQAGALLHFTHKSLRKLSTPRMKKLHGRGKRHLTDALRKHFGNSKMSMDDPEPRYGVFSRLYRSGFRRQGSVNKAILAALRANLLWQHEMQARLEGIESGQKRLAREIRDLQQLLPLPPRSHFFDAGQKKISHEEEDIAMRL